MRFFLRKLPPHLLVNVSTLYYGIWVFVSYRSLNRSFLLCFCPCLCWVTWCNLSICRLLFDFVTNIEGKYACIPQTFVGIDLNHSVFPYQYKRHCKIWMFWAILSVRKLIWRLEIITMKVLKSDRFGRCFGWWKDSYEGSRWYWHRDFHIFTELKAKMEMSLMWYDHWRL